MLPKPLVSTLPTVDLSIHNEALKAGFIAKTVIDRFDYNLKWDRATEAGGLVEAKR